MPTQQHKPSFEELRRAKAAGTYHRRRPKGKLFETDWEVFIVRYDRDSRTYVSRTVCCETALLSGR